MQLRPKQWRVLSALACITAGAVALAILRIHLAPSRRAGFAQAGATERGDENVPAYADPSSCALCHAQIAATFRLTGMGRSFSKLRRDRVPGDFKIRNRLYHKASDRYYTMIERGGKFYQRRHQLGFEGKETNIVEFEADYEIGSGNHARTFLNRTAEGKLLEMPVSWYSERGGYWAMSPGYDRPAHLDFRRAIVEGCMSCHNAYPRAPVEDQGNGPRFRDPLPEGIDCQRCHGPGQAHVEAMKLGELERGRGAIVNPAKLDRDRQLETCMQCHLEPTSSPLPFEIQRYEHSAFSFIPGKALGEYFIYFDHAPGSGREDKFEIAGAAYRLRKSLCFRRSQLTCLTCHDPHNVPRGTAAIEHYVAVCQSCHRAAHDGGLPQLEGMAPGATCLDCHMPKRRAEDAVHVVITDHFIERRPLTNLLAVRQEAENFELGDYRGEVMLYYPPNLAPVAENFLYLALAQVEQGSNLDDGIPRLQSAIDQYQPQRPEFYYELGRAYARRSNYQADIHWCEEALRRDANFVPAWKELATASAATGNLSEARRTLEKAVELAPEDGSTFADLGNVYLREDRVDDAQKAISRALTLDPNLANANNTMGLVALKKRDTGEAEKYFRAAIRLQPDLAEGQNNLGNLLAGRRSYTEAEYHFERAIRSNPNYVEAHHSYGMVLALRHSYAKAASELEATIRLSPGLAEAHTNLADVLRALGRTNEAVREYETATQANPAEYDAHLALAEIFARRGQTAEARGHFEAAAQSSDPNTRQAALKGLRSLLRSGAQLDQTVNP